tara:strand:- start:947 stop:1438 length:492 start_codon:yes stop_codon:yes gene_type:complete
MSSVMINERGVSSEWNGHHIRLSEDTVPSEGRLAVNFIKDHLVSFYPSIGTYWRMGDSHLVIRNKMNPRKAFFLENHDHRASRCGFGILTTPDGPFWTGGSTKNAVRSARAVGINAGTVYEVPKDWVEGLGWERWGRSNFRKVFDPRGVSLVELDEQLNKLLD